MKYDVAIIGAGPAGYKAAEILGKAGKKTCLIDFNKERIGGTCLNEGCIPVKSMLENCDLYSKIKEAEKHGINCSMPEIDINTFNYSVIDNINKLKKGIEYFLDKYNVDFISGKAQFISNTKLQIMDNTSTKEIEADNILIASGSSVREISGINMDGEYICSSKDLVYRKDIPASIVILGGGVIGCEFATIYNKLGTEVTIIEMLENLLPNEDNEISRTLTREFKKNKIKVSTSTKLDSITIENNRCFLKCSSVNDSCKITEYESDCVLVSIGRIPNTGNLNLQKIGIKTEKGFIPVDSNMKTTINNIYAAGDVVPGPMLAHSAYIEAEKAAASILGKPLADISDYVPSVVFSDPQISSIGINEDKAKERDLAINIHKMFFKANGMALIKGKDTGFVKIISSSDTCEILGASIVGVLATELIHEIALAVHKKLTVNDILSMTHAHPTLSELIRDTLSE